MEYELSFNNFDLDYIRKKLLKLGAKNEHSFYPFKVIYFYLAGEDNFKKGFLRIRSEYPNKVTITTKILSSEFPEEYETHSSENFDDTVKILSKSGLKMKIETVKFREKWVLKPCHEIIIDLWPGLPPIMEVDCDSKKNLEDMVKKLGLDIKDGYTISKYDKIYGIKNEITQSFKNLNFDNYKKLLSKHVKINNDLFKKIDYNYYKSFIPDIDKYL